MINFVLAQSWPTFWKIWRHHLARAHLITHSIKKIWILNYAVQVHWLVGSCWWVSILKMWHEHLGTSHRICGGLGGSCGASLYPARKLSLDLGVKDIAKQNTDVMRDLCEKVSCLANSDTFMNGNEKNVEGWMWRCEWVERRALMRLLLMNTQPYREGDSSCVLIRFLAHSTKSRKDGRNFIRYQVMQVVYLLHHDANLESKHN